ncbi:LamG-like jellyroll fold domain-containing protein, partial [Kibdelosporangium lantanae]
VPSGGMALTSNGGTNVAKFDNSWTGQIEGPRPPNFRSDGSYTVEAWVKHTWTAQDVATAKQQDATNTAGIDKASRTVLGLNDSVFNPLVLGYRAEKDANGVWRPKWQFIIVQPDTTMAVPHATGLYIDGAQDNVWTHLTGTYDASTKTMCVSASTDTKQFTKLCQDGINAFAGSTPTEDLVIGRGMWTGRVSDVWYGDIRGVRVYSGVLDTQRISADTVVDHP